MIDSEAKKLKNWSNPKSIEVSVVCICFNHQEYIYQTISSFLEQETSFSFEIIILDDASSDQSPSIIKNFQKNYPHIIKPILLKENFYSDFETKPFLEALRQSQGTYIAYCDGDDAWLDPSKLQKQWEALQKFPEYNLAFSSAVQFDEENLVLHKVIAKHSNKHLSFIPHKEIVKGGGEFCPSSSLFFRKEALQVIPFVVWKHAPVTDFYVQSIVSNPNGAIFLSNPLSMYRVNVKNSWSQNLKLNNRHYQITKKNILAIDFVLKNISNINKKPFEFARSKLVISYLRNNFISVNERQQAYKEFKHVISKKDKVIWAMFFRFALITKTLRAFKKLTGLDSFFMLRNASKKLIYSTLLIFFTFFISPLPWFLGEYLIIKNELLYGKGSSILTISGHGEPGYNNLSYQGSVIETINLFKTGDFKEIALISGKKNRIQESEIMYALISTELSSKNIVIIENNARSTYELVNVAINFADEKNINNLVIITGGYHSRRLSLVWNKINPNNNISFHPTIYYDPDRKWFIPINQSRIIFYEYAAIFYYFLRGWV